MAARLPSLAQIHPRLPDFMQLMRLDRPIGTLLLLWPTLWALWFAAEGFPHPGILVVFVLGVFIMRAAGCVINDYADRHVDGHVKRTRERPLATGKISEKEALTLFFGLCLAAFLLVLFFTNTLTLQLSFIGVALAFVYPFMKRYTHLPQLFLGAAFSMAIPMAWAAQTGEIAQLAWVLFLANLVWTVAYDTLYAMVDRDDDVKIGIKSTAVLLGDLDRPVIAFLQVMVVITLLLAGHQAGLSWFYNLGVLVMAGLFIHQQRLTRHRTRPECFQAFLNNNWAGCAVFLGVFLDYLLLS